MSSIANWHLQFKIGYDKTDSLNYPNFLPEEIDVFLNKAIERFIEQRAYGTNSKKEGLEETQKRLDDLRNIIKNYTTTTFTNTVNNKPNGVFITLPEDYRHAIQEDIKINYTLCTGTLTNKIAKVIPVTHDRYNRIIEDPFNKPYEDQIIRMGYEGNTLELITDGNTTVNTYYLRYIKTPPKVQYGSTYSTPTTDVDCILADSCHFEIIDIAVDLALENVNSNRLATFDNVVKTNE